MIARESLFEFFKNLNSFKKQLQETTTKTGLYLFWPVFTYHGYILGEVSL